MRRAGRTGLAVAALVFLASTGLAAGLDDLKAGTQAYARRDNRAAVRLFTAAIQSGQLSQEHLAIALHNRGLAEEEQNDLEGALADYNKALELSPNRAETHNGKGNVWFKRRKFDLAVHNYTRAIELNPGYVRAYVNRGTAYRAVGDKAKARADFHKAKQLMPQLSVPEL